MKREEANRISVNDCLTDEQLAEIREAREAADPGAWRVATSPGEAPRVERYNREPWARPEATLRFMAKSEVFVGRLLRGVEVLEKEVRHAWLLESIRARELSEERAGREQDALRRSEGKMGPEREIALLARHASACARIDKGWRDEPWLRPQRYEHLLRRWAGGESIASEIEQEVESLEREVADRLKREREWEEGEKANVADLQRRLREALDALARGQVVEELKKPLREVKRRIRKETSK